MDSYSHNTWMGSHSLVDNYQSILDTDRNGIGDLQRQGPKGLEVSSVFSVFSSDSLSVFMGLVEMGYTYPYHRKRAGEGQACEVLR